MHNYLFCSIPVNENCKKSIFNLISANSKEEEDFGNFDDLIFENSKQESNFATIKQSDPFVNENIDLGGKYFIS